jgi:hypothetical protein
MNLIVVIITFFCILVHRLVHMACLMHCHTVWQINDTTLYRDDIGDQVKPRSAEGT